MSSKKTIPQVPESSRKAKVPLEVKLHKEQEIKIEKTDKCMMLIARPIDIDSLMKKVGRGKLTTVNHIREKLASEHEVDFTCPLITGIFVWIAAEAAADKMREGKTRVTPFWRTLKSDASLNEKYPGGVEYQKAMLEAEGHTVLSGKDKKPPIVDEYQKSLVKLRFRLRNENPESLPDDLLAKISKQCRS